MSTAFSFTIFFGSERGLSFRRKVREKMLGASVELCEQIRMSIQNPPEALFDFFFGKAFTPQLSLTQEEFGDGHAAHQDTPGRYFPG